MENNFANWELTGLLPDKSSLDINFRLQFLIDEDNNIEYFWIEDLSEHNKIAWTWEDIRLYLERKGFYISIYQNNGASIKYEIDLSFPELEIGEYLGTIYTPFPASNSNYWIDKYSPCEDSEFTTYEEAREHGIKYCLTLIKNNES